MQPAPELEFKFQSDLESIVALSSDLLGIADQQGHFKLLNPAWTEVLGYTTAELKAQPFISFVHPDDVASTLAVYDNLMSGEELTRFQNRYRTKAGTYRWLSWKAKQSRDDQIVFSARDVTEEIKAKSDHETISQSLSAHAIVAITDKRGKILSANDEFCRVSGFSREELVGASHKLVNSGEHPKSFFEEMWQTILSGQVWRGEIQNRTKNGAPYWVDTTITPVFDVAGEIERFISVRHETTERKLVTDQLKRDARLFGEIADVSGVGAWEVDIASGQIYWDDTTRQIHEVDADYVPNLERGISFYAPEAQPIISDAVQHSIETGDPWDLELPFITSTGRDIWVRAIGRCVRENDTPKKLVGAFQEITLKKEHEIVLRQMRDKAIEASTAKTQFLGTVSHEVRTPLHGILGITNILLRTVSDPQLIEHLKTILNSGETLLSLINDVIDISRIESGLLELHKSWSSPTDLVQEVAAGLKPLASKKGTSINIDSLLEPDDQFELDGVRFKQIISNLVGNASKFTENGQINIALEHRNGALEVAVSDTGIGMTPEQQRVVFERFKQADGTIQRKFGGSGLGLSIVADLVDAMGGEVSLSSVPEEGSVFTVKLLGLLKAGRYSQKTNDLSQSPSQPTDLAVGEGRRALIVDDVATNCIVGSALLKQLGFETTVCDSGQAAIAALEREEFDVVFMDLHMPAMSGDEAIALIRNSSSSYCDIPIIVLTADVSPKATEICEQVGANGVCRKPFKLEDIYAHCERVLR